MDMASMLFLGVSVIATGFIIYGLCEMYRERKLA